MEEVQSLYLTVRIHLVVIFKLRPERLNPNFLKRLPELLIVKVLHDSLIEFEILIYESKTSGLEPCQSNDFLGPSFDECHQLTLSLSRLGFVLKVL